MKGFPFNLIVVMPVSFIFKDLAKKKCVKISKYPQELHESKGNENSYH